MCDIQKTKQNGNLSFTAKKVATKKISPAGTFQHGKMEVNKGKSLFLCILESRGCRGCLSLVWGGGGLRGQMRGGMGWVMGVWPPHGISTPRVMMMPLPLPGG